MTTERIPHNAVLDRPHSSTCKLDQVPDSSGYLFATVTQELCPENLQSLLTKCGTAHLIRPNIPNHLDVIREGTSRVQQTFHLIRILQILQFRVIHIKQMTDS